MPPADEKAFESHFCHQLEIGGYRQHKHGEVDRDLCLHIGELEEFLADTQPEALRRLKENLGQSWRDEIIKAYAGELKVKKPFELLRDGLRVDSECINLTFFKPTLSHADEQERNYRKNRFSYVRQYVFEGQESIDVVLFLNGIAIVTIELKNLPTGQYVGHAVKQYLERNLDHPIFRLPFLHIAADNERVKVAANFTHRNEDDFRDFNTGLINPQPNDKNEYPVHFLYHEVLLPDSMLNVIERYLVSEGRKWIFPRYHQRRAVKRILDDVVQGFAQTGKLDKRYLAQHSAGSGKSNTIIWLVQNIRDLFVNDVKLFDYTVVVTDRVNLDGQISDDFQQAITQSDVVGYPDSAADLRDDLANGRKVIVSTIHKFSHIRDLVLGSDKRVCFIIDEGHRSQSGDLHTNLTETFFPEVKTDSERKSFPNAAIIALTATPSDLALQQFGRKEGDEWKPFDVYSMDEAIKEKYILDVAQNLVPYETLYQLSYKYQSAHEYAPLPVYRALHTLAYEDDDMISEKVGIMLRIFEEKSAHKIGGKAKTMVVTSSRLAAVKYKRYFDESLKRKPYKALVAFTGKVEYEGREFTEHGMNKPTLPRPNMKTEDAFGEDDSIRFLIVADKFQTGFDQPLLHTMFLDKKVSGINAVQTLSRLNRKYPDKEDTLTVDFTGSTDKILRAFKKFQGHVETRRDVDPNELSALFQKLLKRDVFTMADIEEFIRLRQSENPSDSAPLTGLLCDIKKRYEEKYAGTEERREFRTLLGRYLGLYRYVRALFNLPEDELHDFNSFAAALYPVLVDPKSAEELRKELEYVRVLVYEIKESELQEVHESPKRGRGDGGDAPPQLNTVEEVVTAINTKFKDLMTARDGEAVEEYLAEVTRDEELITDVRSNLDNDRDLIFTTIIEPKLNKRYSDFVISHAVDRYEPLMNNNIAAFVARNAYHLLRQSAMGAALR